MVANANRLLGDCFQTLKRSLLKPVFLSHSFIIAHPLRSCGGHFCLTVPFPLPWNTGHLFTYSDPLEGHAPLPSLNFLYLLRDNTFLVENAWIQWIQISLLKKIYLFIHSFIHFIIWLCRVLVGAHGLSSCGAWSLQHVGKWQSLAASQSVGS